MNKIFLWAFSVILILLGIITFQTSIVASILFFISGAYLSPIIRSKFLANFENTPLMGKRVGFAFVSVLVVIGFYKFMDGSDANSVEQDVKRYQSNPADFIVKVNKQVEDKKFFGALFDLDRIIPSIPNDQTLKNLRHETTIAEIKFNASIEKLYLFDDKSLAKYKEIMGATSNENDIFKTYIDLASSYIAKEEASKAKEVIKNLVKIASNNKSVGEFAEQIASVNQKIKEREEVIAKKKVEEEAAKKESAQQEAAKKESNSANGKTVYGRNKYTEKDASSVALCFAFLEVSKQPYLAHLEKTHKLYVQDNAAVFYEEIQPAIAKFLKCAGSDINNPATFEACKAQLPKEAPIINEFQRGSMILQSGRESDKAIAAAACMGTDAVIR
jgi:hypothetical protein